MAESTVLQLAQEFCRRQGLPQPSGIVDSVNDTDRQVLGLLNEGIADLADRYEWQQLLATFDFTHGGSGTNYAAVNFTSQCPGFKSMLNRTLWNVTDRLELYGPYSAIEWQQLIIMNVSGARYNFRLAENKLFIFPIPTVPANVTFRFTWLSRFGVFGGSSTPAETYAADTDTPRLPSYIVLQDLKWRWRKEKGLPYAEDQRICEQMIANGVGREPGADLVLDSSPYNQVAKPGLLIPAGNWMS